MPNCCGSTSARRCWRRTPWQLNSGRGLNRLRVLAGDRKRSQLLEQMRGDPAGETERLAEYIAQLPSAKASS